MLAESTLIKIIIITDSRARNKADGSLILLEASNKEQIPDHLRIISKKDLLFTSFAFIGFISLITYYFLEVK